MSRIGKVVWWLGKVLITVALLAWILKKTGLGSISKVLATPGYFLLLAFFYGQFFTLLKTLKWHWLLRRSAQSVTLSESLRSYLVGMTGGFFTPGRLGEVTRLIPLPNSPKSLIVGLVFLDKLTDLAAVLFLSLFGISRIASRPILLALCLLWLAFLALSVFPHYPLRWLSLLLARWPRAASLRDRLLQFDRKIAVLPLSFRFSLFLVSLPCYMVIVVEFHSLLNGFCPTSFATAFLTQPLVMLTNLLPVTIGGLGVREGTAIMLLSGFGIKRAVALSSAFAIFLFNIAFPALLGALCLFYLRGRQKH